MPRCRLAASSLAALGAFLVAVAADAGDVRTTLKLAQEVYEAGTPVRGELTLVNEGEGWAEIPDAAHLARRLELRAAGGKVIHPRDPDRFGAAKTTALGPGGFVGFAFDAAKLFPQLAQPGEYTLAFNPPGQLSAASAPIRILPAFDPNQDYRMRIVTPNGPIVIDLFEKEAPVAVHNVVQLARTGFFDGASIPKIQKGTALIIRGPVTERHRIVPFEKTNVPLLAGTVVLEPAPPGRRPANYPKLIVLLGPKPDWQGRVTAVGQIVEGQEALDRLAAVPTTGPGGVPPFKPLQPVSVDKAEILEAPKGDR